MISELEDVQLTPEEAEALRLAEAGLTIDQMPEHVAISDDRLQELRAHQSLMADYVRASLNRNTERLRAATLARLSQ